MKTLQLIFRNSQGGQVTVSIPEPIEPIVSADVEAAMDAILSADVITSTGGSLTTKVRAQVVLRDVEPILVF